MAAIFRFVQLTALGSLFLFTSCNVTPEDEIPQPPTNPGPIGATCDTSIAPIIFLHGALGSGDTWAIQVQRFLANDLCDDRLYAFDWNSIDQENAPDIAALDLFIEEVLLVTGARQVNLAGHSAGGGLSYEYLSDPDRASKVAGYAHIGSFLRDSLPGPASGRIPMVNIWSPDDQVIDEKGDIPGATNVSVAGKDHYQIATDPATFEAMYLHFSDGKGPALLEPVKETDISISGRALQFGENLPEQGARVEIYALDPGTGRRLGDPVASFIIDETGNWGPISVDADTPYEFYLEPADPEARTVHYYKEPLQSSNPLVYLRTLPGPGSIAALLLSALPEDDQQTVLAVFASSQAVISGRDALEVQGSDLASPDFASADQTSIAFFLYDDGDQMTSGTKHGIFDLAPFLTGADIFISTDSIQSAEVSFNGRILHIPNWKSESEGVAVAIFD